MMKSILLVFVALAGASVLTGCEEGDTVINSADNGSAGISVTGTGRVYGAPDIVNLQLGVQAEARTVAEARETAARTLQAIVNSVKGNGVDEKDIQTTSFSISPQYDTPPAGSTQPRTIRAYRVSNVVSLKIRKIDTASKVIDDAVSAGGNNTVVQGFSFTIDDPTKLREEARELAMKEAKQRGDQLARLAGVGLGDPISINESFSQPFIAAAPAVIAPRTGVDTSTPIQAGELEVVVNVNVTYGIK